MSPAPLPGRLHLIHQFFPYSPWSLQKMRKLCRNGGDVLGSRLPTEFRTIASSNMEGYSWTRSRTRVLSPQRRELYRCLSLFIVYSVYRVFRVETSDTRDSDHPGSAWVRAFAPPVLCKYIYWNEHIQRQKIPQKQYMHRKGDERLAQSNPALRKENKC